MPNFSHLIPENRELLDPILERNRRLRVDPLIDLPWLFRPCRVRVLLVADSTIDYSDKDFGLSTFVRLLLHSPPGPYVNFEVTLAHMGNPLGDGMLTSESDVARRITGFRFDNSDHFGTEMYDQVWLFGFSSSYSDRENDDYLDTSELEALHAFMDAGGGVFATGDHGSLGRAMSGAVKRVKSMRMWSDDGSGTVSMSGPNRNDTNKPPSVATGDFYNQSDDIPQTVQPKMYHVRSAIWRVSYPHPLLCGPEGVIRVMPDHPHEGECVVPTSPDSSEFPSGSGSLRPLPEVISTSSVLAGLESPTRFGDKDPTVGQTFGGIAAYDGHPIELGRVVTDATWHHFININLVGDSGFPAGDVKAEGFLHSASGQAHFEQIKHYFRNIALWIARPERVRCMNRHLLWHVLWSHRLVEAVSSHSRPILKQVSLDFIFDVGRHARNAIGRYASQCQSRRLMLDLIRPRLPDWVIDDLDPWRPMSGDRPLPEPIPWVDPEPILDLALGGALLAVHETFPDLGPKTVKKAEKSLDEVADQGVELALSKAGRSAEEGTNYLVSMVQGKKGPGKGGADQRRKR